MHPQPSGTRLDPWYGSYSARTHEMKASEIRALFAVANRPEVVSLAGGMPNIADLPMDSFADAVAQLLRTQGARALQYGSGQGDPELRSQISEIMALEAINAHPDDVVVTTGSQQALDLVSRIFLDPGDTIVAEAPSYVGALGVFSAYQANVVHTPMDADGLIPEALDEVLTDLAARGIELAWLTLHVGAGTFQPVRVHDIAEHRMHSERFEIPPATVEAIARTKARGGRIIAVGTTSLRALEASAQGGAVQAGAAETDIFITPGYRFRVVDRLITNFHLPKSTLLMLVSAFAGSLAMRAAYRHAVEQQYRFFSYGDAMLLEKEIGDRPL